MAFREIEAVGSRLAPQPGKCGGGLGLRLGPGPGPAGTAHSEHGLGNLITELMTLPGVLHGLPLPLMASWRGHYQESIEAQTILGERVLPMLRGLLIPVTVIESPDDLDEFENGVGECFDRAEVRVFLLSPRLWEGDSLRKHRKRAILE